MSRICLSPGGREVAALVESLPPRRFLLGLSGAPGVGKSSLAAALAAAYAVPVVAMDGFHRPEAELTSMGRLAAKGAPDTFDAPAYGALLAQIRTGSADVLAPAFDHGASDPVRDAIIVPAGSTLVVTEGNYLMLDAPEWRSVRAELDTVWHLVVSEPLRDERLLRRHIASGKSADVARSWVDQVDRANARLVEAAAARADVVLDLSGWDGALA